MPVGVAELDDADQALGEELGDGQVEAAPAARSAGASSSIQVRAPSSVKGWGTSVQAAICSSFIIADRAVTSSSSKARRTNRSVLMEMLGKVLVMRRSVTCGPSKLISRHATR